MDKIALINLLVRPGDADKEPCKKLSRNKFIAVSDWETLKRHEAEFLRAYAMGAGSPTSALVLRSAAAVHNMWTIPVPGTEETPVYLANPNSRPRGKKTWPEGVEYVRMHIPPMDLFEFKPTDTQDTLRLTTTVRTAVDIARLQGVRAGVIAMDSLFSTAQTKNERNHIKAKLETTIERLSGKKGIEDARQALEWSSTRSESPYESLVRLFLRERDIIAQEQMWIGQFARADLLWGQVIIEIDGEVKLDDNPKQAAYDQLERENWIRSQNYEVVRLTTHLIKSDEEECMRRINEMHERSLQLPPPLTEATQRRPTRGVDWRSRSNSRSSSYSTDVPITQP